MSAKRPGSDKYALASVSIAPTHITSFCPYHTIVPSNCSRYLRLFCQGCISACSVEAPVHSLLLVIYRRPHTLNLLTSFCSVWARPASFSLAATISCITADCSWVEAEMDLASSSERRLSSCTLPMEDRMLWLVPSTVLICRMDSLICSPKRSTCFSISLKASPVEAMVSAPAATFMFPSSMEVTARWVSCWIPAMRAEILQAASLDCSASFLTSSATTENPLPASPALAASIATFRARRHPCLKREKILADRIIVRVQYRWTVTNC